jgi:hypothetical protein
VRVGAVGSFVKELPAAVVDELDAIWRQVVTPRFGATSYAELTAGLDARRSRARSAELG